jgi:Flp pilus assembly pilin Flp
MGEGNRTDLPTSEEMLIRTYSYFASIMVGLREHERGQTMAEYAVVLAVITVAIVGTLGFLAGGIKSSLNSVTSKL